MERIKAAIEKAKYQEASVLASRARRFNLKVHDPDAMAEVENITYEQTKVYSLDLVRLKESRIVAFDSSDPATAAFDVLRTQVVSQMRKNSWKSLAIVSPTPYCGKTVVSINLAVCLARQTNATVLLVDFDLRRPKISQYLGIKVDHYISDYVENNAQLTDLFVNPGIPRLVILPNNRAVNNATEVLTSKVIRKMVEELKSRYESRFVIFDLPPLLPTDDAIAFLDQVDCVLLVVAEGSSTQAEITKSLRLLDSFKMLGTVLNKANVKDNSYY